MSLMCNCDIHAHVLSNITVIFKELNYINKIILNLLKIPYVYLLKYRIFIKIPYNIKNLSRSLFLYFKYLVSVTAGGPESPRGHM